MGEDLGGIIFLQDPMYAHPHQADIDCLNRQALVHEIIVASNPASAYAITAAFRFALRKGKKEILSSFFRTNQSPCVLEYRRLQERSSRRFIMNHTKIYADEGSE